MQHAVASLSSLKYVRLWVSNCNERWDFFAPLAVFAAAASLEALSLLDYTDNTHVSLPYCYESLDQTRGCFKRLQRLRNFRLFSRTGAPPLCTELISELSSTQLTALLLCVKVATIPLMRQVGGLRNLQRLRLDLHGVCGSFLDPLLNLKSLTVLQINVNERVRHQSVGLVSGLNEVASRLRSSILESASRVGVAADVKVPIFVNSV